MEQEILEARISDAYGFIFEKPLISQMAIQGEYAKVPSGFTLMEPGETITSMPLLLTGSIKIMREDANGNELLLYYLERGDTCAMSMNCCLGNKKSEVIARAEEDTEIVRIPVNFMKDWLCEYDSWKTFVFDSYNSRLHEMLEIIDSIAFMNMDQRLYKYLHDKVKLTGSTTIHNTHQEIATELHTSRVVISRLLKKLEQKGGIELYRNKIEVLDF